jgi:hypothetical protein
VRKALWRQCGIKSIFMGKSAGALFTVGAQGSRSGKLIGLARVLDVSGGDKTHDSHRIWILVPKG